MGTEGLARRSLGELDDAMADGGSVIARLLCSVCARSTERAHRLEDGARRPTCNNRACVQTTFSFLAQHALRVLVPMPPW